MKYSGIYYGIKFAEHIYEPKEYICKNLAQNFTFKHKIGDRVRARRPHRKTVEGEIIDCFYTSEGSFYGSPGGGTLKAYKLGCGKVFYEGHIKI